MRASKHQHIQHLVLLLRLNKLNRFHTYPSSVIIIGDEKGSNLSLLDTVEPKMRTPLGVSDPDETAPWCLNEDTFGSVGS
jgi:hypothetical protein